MCSLELENDTLYKYMHFSTDRAEGGYAQTEYLTNTCIYNVRSKRMDISFMEALDPTALQSAVN